jgi:hypothetical protein
VTTASASVPMRQVPHWCQVVEAVARTLVAPPLLQASVAYDPPSLAAGEGVIPLPTDQNPCAQLRRPKDMMRQG